VNREPTLNDLIGGEPTGDERQQLQHVHEMLLEAGPPPELGEKLEAGPTLGMTLARQRHRRKLKRRGMVLLAAAILVFMVFVAGYASRSTGGGGGGPQAVITQQLKGTSLVPQAQGTLQVWNSQDAGTNWPMTLTVVGLPTLAPHNYYEVYLVRNGKPWGSCGTFRVGNSRNAAGSSVTVTLTAPYTLHPGDTWVVTRPGSGGTEPGQTVLSSVKT
jgi:hypothetical protein